MPKLSDKEFMAIADNAMDKFSGNSDKLEAALGALMIGRRMGWKTLFLIHTRSTIKNYEKILGVEFRDILEDETDDSPRSVAYIAVQKVSNFWKAVKGEIEGVRSQEIKKSHH